MLQEFLCRIISYFEHFIDHFKIGKFNYNHFVRSCIILALYRFLDNLVVSVFPVAVNENTENLSNGQTSESLPQSYDSNNSQSQTPVPPPRKVSNVQSSLISLLF